MDIYLAGTAVTLSVPLQDRSGNALDVASVEYRVIDQAGGEKVARTALSDFTPGDTEAMVSVPADVNQIAGIPENIGYNQIDQFNPREARTVELFLIDAAGNTTILAKSYALEPSDVLIVGLNSFQTLTQADLLSLEIPNVSGWAAASEHEKITALIEARVRICQLRFTLIGSNINFGQDNLNYVPEGSWPTPYAGPGMFMFNGNLALMTPANFVRLPPRFKTALSKAQVAEADAILGGDPVETRRQEGMILESIGESKQMFRSAKPLDLPVSRRALKYLSPFVTFSKHIGRG